MLQRRLRRARIALGVLSGALGMLTGAAGITHADPGAQLDRFYAGTPNSPTYPYPGAERAPLLAQTSGGGPGGSGSISTYGMSDRPATGGVSPSAANPYTSLIFNGYYADFSKPDSSKAGDVPVPGFPLGPDVGAGKPGLQLAETELGIYGNVDPYLYANAVLSFAPDNGVAVEEAFLQTTSLPFGFIAKAGRYHSSIGYLNVFHRHADDFVDTPLVYSAFLNGQLADDGVQLRWLAPTDVLLEFGAELLNGQNWPAAGSGNNGKGTTTQFVKLADDVGEGGSYLLGLSHVDTAATDRRSGGDNAGTHANGLAFTGTNALNIASLVYKWSPLGNAKYTLLKLQGEYFSGDEHGTYTVLDGDGLPTRTTIDLSGSKGVQRTGWYSQAVLKFYERWRIALRQSEVTSERGKDPNALGTALDSQGRVPSISSAMLEFWPSEFSQFRLQYSADQTVPRHPVDRVTLQYILIIGAHAAHTY
jgi:hypothetical protein